WAPPGAAGPSGLHRAGGAGAAAEAWRVLGCPYGAAPARSEVDDVAARREAHETLERLGAHPLADRVARRLRESGVRGLRRRPREATRYNPAGLTSRELEVLRLVAPGLRHARIAGPPLVSPKTLGHPLSALLAHPRAPPPPHP